MKKKYDPGIDGPCGQYVWIDKYPRTTSHVVDESDSRFKRHKAYFKKTGIHPSETWNLCDNIARFLVPRLKLFRKVAKTRPADLTEEEWLVVLDKMIWSFEEMLKDTDAAYTAMSEKERKEYDKKCKMGRDLFAKYMIHLTW